MPRLSLALPVVALLLALCAASAPAMTAQTMPLAAAAATQAGQSEKAGDDDHGGHAHHHGVDGSKLGLWLVIPFAGILLCIALCPLFAPAFWHHHYGKIAAGWGLLAALLLIAVGEGGGGGLMATLQSGFHVYVLDYVPFIMLLFGLFTIAGGIYIKGDFRGTPLTNTVLLLVGTAIASWVGTTGASMLMIHPVLRANKQRKRKVHIIVFFIFLVSNIGGSLTPLGDPPLFLGFLKGVPFTWTFNLLPQMALLSGILLGVFFAFDAMMYRREQVVWAEDNSKPRERIGLSGVHNIVFLAGLIAAVVGYGSLQKNMMFYYADSYEHEILEARMLENIAREVEEQTSADISSEITRLNTLLSRAEQHERLWAYAGTLEHDAASRLEDIILDDPNAHTPAQRDTLRRATLAAERFRRNVHAGFLEVESRLLSAAKDASRAAEEVDAARQNLARVLRAHAGAVVQIPRETAVKGIHFGEFGHLPYSNLAREGLILLMALLSLLTTRKAIRAANNFNWAPIAEVAKLFAGIFICMVPALAILQAGLNGGMRFIIEAVQYPWQFFWATGLLSSFLDNAPTYLVFFQTGQATPMVEFAARGLAAQPVSAIVDMPNSVLVAISCGAVFMGANTYIGNAPNFMVKAIAEQNDIKMPSFVGYMLWSMLFLTPLFILLTLIFLR